MKTSLFNHGQLVSSAEAWNEAIADGYSDSLFEDAVKYIGNVLRFDVSVR